MAGIAGRLGGFLYDIDRALNTLGGGLSGETISGTLGRGLDSHPPKWWALVLAPALDWLVMKVWKEPAHCRTAAAVEARRRLILGIRSSV